MKSGYKIGVVKKVWTLFLIFLLSINSFAAIVSDNDGSAFITKAEFDALKSSFQSQIDTYNQSIDSKIDGAIASYLSGIRIAKETEIMKLCNQDGFYSVGPDTNWKFNFNESMQGTCHAVFERYCYWFNGTGLAKDWSPANGGFVVNVVARTKLGNPNKVSDMFRLKVLDNNGTKIYTISDYMEYTATIDWACEMLSQDGGASTTNPICSVWAMSKRDFDGVSDGVDTYVGQDRNLLYNAGLNNTIGNNQGPSYLLEFDSNMHVSRYVPSSGSRRFLWIPVWQTKLVGDGSAPSFSTPLNYRANSNTMVCGTNWHQTEKLKNDKRIGLAYYNTSCVYLPFNTQDFAWQLNMMYNTNLANYEGLTKYWNERGYWTNFLNSGGVITVQNQVVPDWENWNDDPTSGNQLNSVKAGFGPIQMPMAIDFLPTDFYYEDFYNVAPHGSNSGSLGYIKPTGGVPIFKIDNKDGKIKFDLNFEKSGTYKIWLYKGALPENKDSCTSTNAYTVSDLGTRASDGSYTISYTLGTPKTVTFDVQKNDLIYYYATTSGKKGDGTIFYIPEKAQFTSED